jgi:hypothetical protein
VSASSNKLNFLDSSPSAGLLKNVRRSSKTEASLCGGIFSLAMTVCYVRGKKRQNDPPITVVLWYSSRRRSEL